MGKVVFALEPRALEVDAARERMERVQRAIDGHVAALLAVAEVQFSAGLWSLGVRPQIVDEDDRFVRDRGNGVGLLKHHAYNITDLREVRERALHASEA